MNYINIFPDVIFTSLANLFGQFVEILPNILAALIVFIFGLFISEWLGRLATKILKKLYLDKAVNKSGSKKILEKVGLKYEISKVVGLLVTWFLYLVFLIAIADILNLPQITEFLESIVLYIPNVVVAVVILVVGVLIADLSRSVVTNTMEAHSIHNSKFVGSVARWAIVVFSIMAALVHLKVATELITIFFSGLVFMFALAGGLSLGLGGKNWAEKLLRKMDSGDKK